MIWLILGIFTLSAAALIVFSLYGTHEDGRHHMAGPIILSVLLPLAAFSFYLLGGKPGLPSAYFHDSQEEITNIEAHLKGNPNDADGWLALAQLYASRSKLDEAENAWGKAASLAKDNLEVQLDYASFLLTNPKHENLLPPQFPALVLQIEHLAPSHPLTLFYKGLVEKSQGNTQSALDLWNKLLTLLPSDSPLRTVLEKEIAEMR